jgi:hypothetical protein
MKLSFLLKTTMLSFAVLAVDVSALGSVRGEKILEQDVRMTQECKDGKTKMTKDMDGKRPGGVGGT